MTGWICPKCGSVYAPFVAECRFCTGGNTATRTYSSNSSDQCPSCRGPREQPAMTGCPPGWHSETWR